MKRYLLIATFLTIAFAGYSQPGSKTDTICLPVNQVQRGIRTHDSLQVMKQEKDSLNALIIIQENRLVSKDSTIRDLRNANFAAFNAITAVRNSMANALQQRDLQREDMKYFQKLYHKQRKKTFWATVAGIAAAVGTIIILK